MFVFGDSKRHPDGLSRQGAGGWIYSRVGMVCWLEAQLRQMGWRTGRWAEGAGRDGGGRLGNKAPAGAGAGSRAHTFALSLGAG